MKLRSVLILVFIFMAAQSNAATENLAVASDVSIVSSKDGPYEARYSSAVRYRAIVRDALGSEGEVSLVIEKYAPGREGSSDKVIYSEKFDTTQFPGVKKKTDEIVKKSMEAIYGCCKVSDLNWTKDSLEFKVEAQDEQFACVTSSLDSNKVAVNCK